MKALRMFAIMFLFVFVVLSACGDSDSGDGEPIAEKGTVTVNRVLFEPAVGIEEALSLSGAASEDLVRYRVDYPDHVYIHRRKEPAPISAGEVIAAERNRLVFLRSKFSPGNPRERAVWSSLDEDLRLISSNVGPKVGWIEVIDRFIRDGSNDYARQTFGVGSVGVSATYVSTSIVDWPEDDLYVPAGGTSSIYESGSLQKFWLDGIGDKSLSESQDGLEIRTVFDTPGLVDCEMGEGASNLPNFYVHDWSLNFGYADYCAIGTTNAQALRPGVLYWTWTPFRSFLTSANPRFTIEYRPLEWCPWVESAAACEWLGGTYCLCRRIDLPPQPLVTYSFFDAPGREVPWWRN